MPVSAVKSAATLLDTSALPTGSELVATAERIWDKDLYLGSTLQAWVIAGAVTLGVLLLAWLVKSMLATRLRALAQRTTTQIDDLLAELIGDLRLPLLAILAVVIGTRFLSLPTKLENVVTIATVIAIDCN